MTITKFELNNDWTILDTGSVINIGKDTPLTIFITEEDGTDIKMRFEIVPSEQPKATVRLKEFDKDTVLLQILSPANGLLTNFGTITPFEIGTYNGKELYFSFRINCNGNEDSIVINYTWYLGDLKK